MSVARLSEAVGSPCTTYTLPGGRRKPASQRRISSRSAWAESPSSVTIRARTGKKWPWMRSSRAREVGRPLRAPALGRAGWGGPSDLDPRRTRAGTRLPSPRRLRSRECVLHAGTGRCPSRQDRRAHHSDAHASDAAPPPRRSWCRGAARGDASSSRADSRTRPPPPGGVPSRGASRRAGTAYRPCSGSARGSRRAPVGATLPSGRRAHGSGARRRGPRGRMGAIPNYAGAAP